MRTLKFHIPVLTCLLLCGILNAQVAIDPVRNVYKIGGSSEIYITYTTKDGTQASHGILDVSTSLDSVTGVDNPFQLKQDRMKTASATGDFNGNGANNVVTVSANENGGITISIPLIGDDLKMNEIKKYDLNEQINTRIRVIAGNFNAGQQNEFAICYDLPDKTITIKVFKTDSDLNIEQIASFDGIAYFDRNFDIAAGDVDGDGIDEIVMVRNKAFPTWKAPPDGYGLGEFISKYDLYIFKYVTGELSMHQESENTLKNIAASSWFYPNKNEIINEMRIACGDLNNDGRNEIIVGWSYYYSYDRERYCPSGVEAFGVCYGGYAYNYFFGNVYWLNTFRSTEDGIRNYQNTGLVWANPFGTRSASKDQLIPMTLKCQQMGSLGGTKVLFNSVGVIYVLGKGDDDMGLKFETQILPSDGYLNIQGNETFAVADMNPDIPALNFNKELIILQSDKTAIQQLDNRYNSKPGIAVVSIDEITAESITFKPPGPKLDIPFSSGENMEITTFLAGDFDLSDAEVFIVGTPVITRVEDIQQPIVILNSPPVHFDVIGGEIIDLCNAYAEKEPAFHATYITAINQQTTTSVKVDKGFGVSADIRTYAMSGGTGFEAAVQANWEKGSSFYKASSQNTTIEDKITIHLEDFILYSYLDYDYYKYPVFNREGEKLGDIAVLNPVSPFATALGSANDWTHPSFVLNHEPGNILSYKQRIRSQDFSTIPSNFLCTEFPGVPVAHSMVDRTFTFTFDHITKEEESYSYSGGVGASLFMKAGLETTATLTIAPSGVGGSVASDIRIGASAELSAFYHNSSLSTHSTELSNAFRIDGTVGMLDKWYDGSARYYIAPYIYRSQSGALVLDYTVELDKDNMDWWEENYGQDPDLAFILPWRYATEKGVNVTASRKQKTSDIQFYPPIARPGDTVVIIARVHNFSLKDFDDLLKVDYYLGNPADGGVKLTDIYGVTGSSKYSTMIYGAKDAINDREEYLTFIWEVPDTVSCSPRIYGVIDPENVYTEIHKNNNVGWNLLNIYDCQECKYAETITQTENISSDKTYYFQAYPNPFSSYCQIRFSLPQPEDVQIDLYNLTGHKVGIVTSERYDSGEHEVSLNAENLATGVYILRITAGSYSEVTRLVLVR
jgi:hypothetical protein